MNFNFNTKRATALVVAAALLTAMVGGAFAAAPSVDTETTETSQTSDLTDAGTQMYNATTSSNLSWSADSANSSVEITQDGRVIFNATPDAYFNNSTSGTYYYNVSLADNGADYDGLEAGANENVTLNVTFTNDTEVSSPDTTNITYTFANGEERAFIAGTDSDTEVEPTSNGTFSVSTVKFWSNQTDPGAARVSDSTTITNQTSEIRIDVQNTNAIDSLSAAASESSGLSLVAFGTVNGQTVPVFVDSADASWLDSNESYVVLDSSGETATVKNAGALVDSSQTVDVKLVGNEAVGFLQTRSMLSSYGAGTIEQITTAASAVDVNGEPDYEAVA